MASHLPDGFCVLGLGRTGVSVARWLLRHHDPSHDGIWVFGGASSQESDETRELAALGAHVVLGTDDVAAPATDDDHAFDLAIVSPGIAPSSRFFQSARASSAELIGEPELAWRISPERWVGITGTNGKTTTTSLMAHLLVSAGLPARTVGNIGTTAIECVDDRVEDEWFCAELSSFQLETTSQLKPFTACLLNVTPDHVEWHGTLEAYAAAKERIFQNYGPGDLAVVSEEDGYCRAICERLEARGVRLCRLNVHADPGTPDAAFLRGDELVVRRAGTEVVLARTEELSIHGEHNAQNALAAGAMALEVGASADNIHAGLLSFAPLEHRIEPAGSVDGVDYVNDSKATNTDSTEKALTAFPAGTIVLLLGGHDKMTPLDTLAAGIRGTCKAIVCYGEAKERFLAELGSVAESGVGVHSAPHMREALELARTLAAPGDTVLLSPACSSYDEFTSYVQRGRVFKALVADMAAADASAEAE